MSTATISLTKTPIMIQQRQKQARETKNDTFDNNRYCNNLAFQKLFPDLTEEQFGQEMEKGLKSIREGRCMSIDESLRRLRDRYGL